MTIEASVPFPDHLDEPLAFVPTDHEAKDVYHVLTALIIPRPIAWVSTVGADGTPNLAPHSWFNMLTHDPPHVMFSSAGVKDTLTNVRAAGEFVLNIPTFSQLEALNRTAGPFPPDVDEFEEAGLESAPAAVVDAPVVVGSPAHLECRVTAEHAVGASFMVVAEVVHVTISPAVWRGGRVDAELLDPLARLSGSNYARLGEIIKLARPSLDDI